MASENAGITAIKLAVLGSPIAHSQSPALHNAAYRELGLDWQYERFEVRESELAAFLDGRDGSWRGLSLTMPLKFAAHAIVDYRDRIAQLTGAVNTVLFTTGDSGERMLRGFNTDVDGIVRSLAEHGITKASHVLVLGGGATAGSAVAAAAALAAERVTVGVRTPAKAEPLRQLAAELGLTVSIVTLDAVSDAARESDLIISTLPGGARLAIEFAADTRSSVPLYDVAYSPWPSELAREWQHVGGSVYSGIGMLVQQALIQIRIFVNRDPAVALPGEPAVLAAMRSAIGAGASGAVKG